MNVRLVQISNEMQNMKSWDDRLLYTTELLKACTPYLASQLADAAKSFYYKLVAADNYQPSSTFQGHVTLFRANDNFVSLDTDYGLTPVSCRCFRLFIIHFLCTGWVYLRRSVSWKWTHSLKWNKLCSYAAKSYFHDFVTRMSSVRFQMFIFFLSIILIGCCILTLDHSDNLGILVMSLWIIICYKNTKKCRYWTEENDG